MISTRVENKIVNQYRNSEILEIETTIKRYRSLKKIDDILIYLNEKLTSTDNEGLILFSNNPDFGKIYDRIGGLNKITYRKKFDVIEEGWIFNKVTTLFKVIDIL